MELIEIDAKHEGEIGAGRLLPFPTTEETTTKVFLPSGIAKSGPIGVLTVRGDSLTDLGIYDGDKLICKQTFAKREINRDTLCVVYLHNTGEVLAKRITFAEGLARLSSFNKNIPDMYAPQDAVVIRGIVVGFQRLFGNRPSNPMETDNIPF